MAINCTPLEQVFVYLGDLGEFNQITVMLQKEGITFLVVATCAARDLRNDSTGRLSQTNWQSWDRGKV